MKYVLIIVLSISGLGRVAHAGLDGGEVFDLGKREDVCMNQLKDSIASSELWQKLVSNCARNLKRASLSSIQVDQLRSKLVAAWKSLGDSNAADKSLKETIGAQITELNAGHPPRAQTAEAQIQATK